MNLMERFHQYAQNPQTVKEQRFDQWDQQHSQWPIGESKNEKVRRELGWSLVPQKH